MEDDASPEMAGDKIQTGWNRFGDLFNAIAIERLVDMGWPRDGAKRELATEENEPRQDVLAKIIRGMRGHKVYPDRPDAEPAGRQSAHPRPNVEILGPPAQETVDRTRIPSLSEAQCAMGAAHFEIRDWVHDDGARVRAIITGQSSGKLLVGCHAGAPEDVLFDPDRTRGKKPVRRGAIPDYSRNLIPGAQITPDDVVEVSDLEIFVTAEMRDRLFPPHTADHPGGSILLTYEIENDKLRHTVEFRLGSRRAKVDLNKYTAAIVCLLVRGRDCWTRWDLLNALAYKLWTQGMSADEIRSASGPNTRGVEYRKGKEMIRPGLQVELGYLAFQAPWLYGHLGSLKPDQKKALEVHEEGKGIRYNASWAWTCETSDSVG